MHTLFLLDLRPKENKFLTIKQALEYLEKQGLKKQTKAIGCARIGSEDKLIKYGTIDEIKI